MNLKHLTKDVGRIIAENSPQILTVLGVVGTVGTAYLAHKAGREATITLGPDPHYSSSEEKLRPLTKKEIVEKTWKLYVPAATAGVMTVGCIIAANRVQARRFAALAAAYGVLSGDFDDFRDKAAEKLGLRKLDETDKELAEKKIQGKLPAGTALPDGQTWFCDMSTMRIFPSTMESVKRAQNKVNYEVNNFKSSSLNEFYEWLELDVTTLGNILGWNSEKPCEIAFEPILTDSHGAVTAFKFTKGPVPNF